MLPTVKIAACHAAPDFLSAAGTTDKALRLIDEAAAHGAHLVVFPEAYIPGFRLWAATGAPIDNTGCFRRYVEQSIYVDGPEIKALRARAVERGVVRNIGFSERSRRSVGCLVEQQRGHRQMCPTYWEKLMWSNGDGARLQVCETQHAGRVGALICGENTNPLARFAMMAQGEQKHIMCFPATWPTKRVGGYKNKTANAVRGAAHALEAKCFTVVCAVYLDLQTKEAAGEMTGDAAVRDVVEKASQATTQFFGPDATGVGDEFCEEEGSAYAECDLDKCIEEKQLHDVVKGWFTNDTISSTSRLLESETSLWNGGSK